MGAFVRHRFDKGFILDEERLRRLNNLVLTRKQQLDGEAKFEYKVYRADSFTFTTESIEDVLREENSRWQKLNRLTISLEAENRNEFSLLLDFDEGETVLVIEGESRDLVFLIFSELRSYLESEVNTLLVLNKDRLNKIVQPIMAVVLVVAAVVWYLVVYRNLNEINLDGLEAALNSSDVEEKLNFLIEVERNRTLFFLPRSIFQNAVNIYASLLILFLVLFPLAYLSSEKGVNLARYFYPEYIFLIGKEIERYEQKQSLYKNVLWVIVVGLVVSVIAGLIVWWIT